MGVLYPQIIQNQTILVLKNQQFWGFPILGNRHMDTIAYITLYGGFRSHGGTPKSIQIIHF